jgi:hypothetical protein
MKIFTILSLVIGCLLLGNIAHSEERVKKARWYQVNLTFFQQKPDPSLNEAFAFEELELTMSDALKLHTDNQFTIASSGMNAVMALHHENSNGKAFIKQNISEDWGTIINKLDPVKQPILHNVQWVQPVYGEQHSLPVYFESSTHALGQPKLKGVIELHVSRYLHSNMQLQYIPNKARSLNETISLQQKRRMRSKEIHYLDHPYMAALIRIIPVEHPLNETIKADALDAQSVLNERI